MVPWLKPTIASCDSDSPYRSSFRSMNASIAGAAAAAPAAKAAGVKVDKGHHSKPDPIPHRLGALGARNSASGNACRQWGANEIRSAPFDP
jgi:hypothetical protein